MGRRELGWPWRISLPGRTNFLGVFGPTPDFAGDVPEEQKKPLTTSEEDYVRRLTSARRAGPGFSGGFNFPP